MDRSNDQCSTILDEKENASWVTHKVFKINTEDISEELKKKTMRESTKRTYENLDSGKDLWSPPTLASQLPLLLSTHSLACDDENEDSSPNDMPILELEAVDQQLKDYLTVNSSTRLIITPSSAAGVHYSPFYPPPQVLLSGNSLWRPRFLQQELAAICAYVRRRNPLGPNDKGIARPEPVYPVYAERVTDFVKYTGAAAVQVSQPH